MSDVVPDYCEAITGYRTWKLVHGEIRPLIMSGNVSAWCPLVVAEAHKLPMDATTNVVNFWPTGLHAYKTPWDHTTLMNYGDYKRGEIWGEVLLWGQVVEHERGYRAQFAYPKRIVTTRERFAQDNAVAAAYGVPIITLKDWRRERAAVARKEWWHGVRRTVARLYRRTVEITRGAAANSTARSAAEARRGAND